MNSKTRQHRTLPIEANLRPWLSARGEGCVFYSRTQFRQAIQAADIGEWKQDQLRHGFGSYWLAVHNDEARLAQIMGNSPEIIHRHYRVPVSKVSAKAYFEITP